MLAEIKIYSESHDIVLTTNSMAVFAKAVQNIGDKEGEDFVQALLQQPGRGGISRITRHTLRDGKLSDGPNGEPSLQYYDTDGNLYYEEHNKNGEMTVKDFREQAAVITGQVTTVPTSEISPPRGVSSRRSQNTGP